MSVARILSSWLAICVLMIANGAARELWLVRAIGRPAGDVVSALSGTTIVLLATAFFFRPLAGRPTAELARVSLAFVGLTVAFEFSFGHYVDHKSWEELFANYAVWRGRLWPIVLLVLALTPWIWGRWAAR